MKDDCGKGGVAQLWYIWVSGYCTRLVLASALLVQRTLRGAPHTKRSMLPVGITPPPRVTIGYIYKAGELQEA